MLLYIPFDKNAHIILDIDQYTHYHNLYNLYCKYLFLQAVYKWGVDFGEYLIPRQEFRRKEYKIA
jgi:hypothetical protein